MKYYPIQTKYYARSALTGVVSHAEWARAVILATDEHLKGVEPKPCDLCLGDGCPDCIDGFTWPILSREEKAQIFEAVKAKYLEATR